jgi:hypothetical protein
VQLASRRLRAEHPEKPIAFRTYLNLSAVANMTAQMQTIINTDGCNVVLALSDTTFTKYPGGIEALARRYPHVFFWANAEMIVPFPNVSNAVISMVDVTSSFFQIGAAAAVECSSCVGLLVLDAADLGKASVMSRGMNFGQQFRGDGANVTHLCPLLAFHFGNILPYTTSATAFTRAMQRRGCSVIVTPGGTPLDDRLKVVDSMTKVFTVASGADAVHYLGDSVLTSQVIHYENLVFRVMEGIVRNTSVPSGLILDETSVGSVSTLTSRNTSAAIAAANAAVGSNYSVVWCPPM